MMYVYCDDLTQTMCPVEAKSAEEACESVWDRIKVKVLPSQLHVIRSPADIEKMLKQIQSAVKRDGLIEGDE